MASDYPPPVEAKNPILRQKEQRNLGIGLLVVLLLFASLILYRHFQDDRPKARIGELVDAADPVPVPMHRTILVPGLSVDVGVTADLDDVPDDVAVRTMQAPDDASFIGVRVTDEQSTTLPVFGNGTGTTAESGVHLTLVAGGHDYPLGAGDPSDPSELPIAGYLPVRGTPSSVGIKATWGGRSQTVDLRTGKRDEGDFAFLYGHRSASTSSCGTTALPAGWSASHAPSCRYRADRYAYAYGHGWAPTGKSWLVITLSVQAPTALTRKIDGANVEFYRYGPGDDQPTVRIDGRRAVDSSPQSSSDSATYSVVLLLVVPSSPRAHTLTTSYQNYYVARIAPPGVVANRYVTASWSTSVRG